MSANLLHALYDGQEPDARAYRFDEGPWRSRAFLRHRVGQMAAALSQIGVEAGDRVSFKIEKSEDVLILAHACLQRGAILHPLNTAYTETEVCGLVADAEPRVFICGSEVADRFRAVLNGVLVETLDPAMTGTLGVRASASTPLSSIFAAQPNDIAALLYTSGTTGRPKGACITHGNLAESARALAQVWKIGPADCLVHALPMYHAHGLLTAVNATLVGGGSILFRSQFDAADVIGALPDATVIMGVPTHYGRLIKADGLAGAARCLRLAISGSAPLPNEIASRFTALTGCSIIERYGATETAIVTAIPTGVKDRGGFVGWALPGVEIRVRQADGTCSDRSAVGGLETRGHNVFAGYWNRPEADAEAFTADGWFITGDLAEVDASGCVRLLGRSKDLIISGGLNVYPKEIEDALDRHLTGGESAVFGVPHPDFGESVVAAVEGAPVNETALIAALKETLAPYKVPKRIVSVDALPRNRLGKIVKSDLRAAYRGLFLKE